MKRLTLALCAAFLGVMSAQAAQVSQAIRDLLDHTPDGVAVRVIVRMKAPEGLPSVTAAADRVARRKAHIEALQDASRRSQDRLLAELSGGMVHALGVDPMKTRRFWLTNTLAMTVDRRTIERLAQRDDVISIEAARRVSPPRIRPAPARREDPPAATWGLEAMYVPAVRRIFGLTGKGVKVGHLDTGVKADHPDLAGKVILWKDFTTGAKAAPYDDEGHGTHTAGTIAGGSSSGRSIGVAPDAQLVSGRIFSSDGADPENILAAMQWVTDPDGNPATDDAPRVVSNSWGSDDGGNKIFQDAVKKWVDLGIFPCFAAGNAGPDGKVGIPGGYPEAFAVGALDSTLLIADYSSRGPVTWDGQTLVKPDVSAPGSGVLSTWPTGNGFNALDGTSMACPHVAGVVALLLQAKPDLTVADIRKILEDTATPKGDPGKNNLYGSGLVNALRAVGRVLPSMEVSGTLSDEAGHPVTGEVYVDPFAYSVPTDAKGHYVAVLPPGKATLTARAPRRAPVHQDLTAVAAVGQTVDFKLVAAPDATLSGTVKAADGDRPLAAKIVLMGENVPAVTADGATGRFQTTVAVGHHKVLVVAAGQEPKLLPDVVVAPEGVSIDVRLAVRPDVLLVDHDEGALDETWFQSALSALKTTYTTWDTRAMGELPMDVCLAYPVVIWQTGFEYQSPITPAEQAVVAKYLESGGRLYLSGQVAGVTLRNTDFYAKVLKAKWVGVIKRTPQKPVPDVAGIPKDPIGDGLTFSLNGPGSQDNQDYPTVIAPASAEASPILTYTTGPGLAGIKAEVGASRLVYTSFGLEGVRGKDAQVKLLDHILTWLRPTAASRVARVVALDHMRHGMASADPREDASLERLMEDAMVEAASALAVAPAPEVLLDGLGRTDPSAAAVTRELRRSVRAATLDAR